MRDRAKQMVDLGRAVRMVRELERHERWDAERLAAHSRQRLLETVRHAASHSPFYRERFAGIDLAAADLDVDALPTLDRATMLENFDELVTDRQLTLSAVERHLEEISADVYLHGEHRAMASGGTSGARGVFVYGRRDWSACLAAFLRWTGSYLGMTPRLPRRRRVASVAATTPLHMTARASATLDVGLHLVARLDARSPLDELVPLLSGFQPELMTAYPSVAAMLAEEQIAGRLSISPAVIATTSEVRTDAMEERIVTAWGRQPFDCYASTETGLLAADCDRHEGLHVQSDTVHLEVVDTDGRAVAPGAEGARVLVTSLVNRTQPLIRYEMSDLVTWLPAGCACGRPFPLIGPVGGRSDDVLHLPALAGGTLPVHPLALRSPLAKLAAVRQYRVVHDDAGLTVEVVLAPDAPPSAPQDVERGLRDELLGRGVDPPPITVSPARELARHPLTGKMKLVESRVGSRAGPAAP